MSSTTTKPFAAVTYNVQAVSHETGVKPVTLRAWERRYGLPQPVRSESGQRVYTARDIDIVQWLVARRDEGMAISHAVAAWRALESQGVDPLLQAEAAAPPAAADASLIDAVRTAWIEACVAFDEGRAQAALDQAFARWTPIVVARDILQRSVAELGRRWHEGTLTVQQEHFATTMTLRHLERLIAGMPPPTRAERILVGCATHDVHTFSPLLVTFLLRQHGWHVVYLGANVPAAEMRQTLATVRPQLAIFTAQHLGSAAHLPALAAEAHRADIVFAYGGAIFAQVPGLETAIPGRWLGNALEEVPGQVQRLLDSGQPPRLDKSLLARGGRLAAGRSRLEAALWQSPALAALAPRRLGRLLDEVNHLLQSLVTLDAYSAIPPRLDGVRPHLISARPTEAEMALLLPAYATAAAAVLDNEHAALADWLNRLAASVTPAA